VAVKRRSPIIPLILASAALIAGCATISDNDLAARVDGAEYTRDELVAELRELGATDEQLINADIARGQVSGWITERVSEASDPTLVADAYANGVLKSGSVCLEAVGVPTRAEAEAVIDELESGASFTDIFAPFNVNDQLAQTNGRIGCLTITQLPLGVNDPLADSITALNANAPYATAIIPNAESNEDLYVVSRFIPYRELGPDDTPIVAEALGANSLGLAVYVDPQIGTYDNATATVIPLI
jgi:hypothetical protein